MKQLLRRVGAKFYEQVFRVNDSPQKIALGFGIGVFSGIFPGTGPVAAIFLALLFKANRATALFGSIITNTWISIISLLLALKAGAWVFGIKWQSLHESWVVFLNGFNWKLLFRVSALKIILPVVVGYILIALLLGLAAYLITLGIFFFIKNKKGQPLAP